MKTMKISLSRQLKYATTALITASLTASCFADGTPGAPVSTPPASIAPPEKWKTAYYKRGFVGVYLTAWAGGPGATVRSRVLLPFDGTKVRIYLNSAYETDTDIAKITLARCKEGAAPGIIDGTSIPITFAGAPARKIPARAWDMNSDAAVAPIQHGVWYLQQTYSSEKSTYAYGIDGFFSQGGDHHNDPKLNNFSGGGVWMGNVFRVDVLTADSRPTILCYGDSITHGYNSTPNAGKTYPETLGRLTGLPTLNLGVNGDVIRATGGVPAIIQPLAGVETVVVLMGINDIIGGSVKTVADYAGYASTLIGGLKQNGKKVLWGTITPAAGFKAFDASPDMEILRRSINTWIREKSGADGVIDFDAALVDPENPSRMKPEYQSGDWIHPSDAGYQKMAEAAAQKFPPHS